MRRNSGGLHTSSHPSLGHLSLHILHHPSIPHLPTITALPPQPIASTTTITTRTILARNNIIRIPIRIYTLSHSPSPHHHAAAASTSPRSCTLRATHPSYHSLPCKRPALPASATSGSQTTQSTHRLTKPTTPVCCSSLVPRARLSICHSTAVRTVWARCCRSLAVSVVARLRWPIRASRWSS